MRQRIIDYLKRQESQTGKQLRWLLAERSLIYRKMCIESDEGILNIYECCVQTLSKSIHYAEKRLMRYKFWLEAIAAPVTAPNGGERE